MSRLIPSTLALMAVHRQAAASKSGRPWIRAQHLLPEGGSPITTLTRPRRSAQTPSLSVSLGQCATGLTGGGEHGLGAGGFGIGLHDPHALMHGRKTEAVRRERKKRKEELLLTEEAIVGF